jgi:hypothetical protein
VPGMSCRFDSVMRLHVSLTKPLSAMHSSTGGRALIAVHLPCIRFGFIAYALASSHQILLLERNEGSDKLAARCACHPRVELALCEEKDL